MWLCKSFCHEGIRSSRYYWTRVLMGLRNEIDACDKKKLFSPDGNRTKVLHFFQSISTWYVRNVLHFCLKITDSYIDTERQRMSRISKVYFKIPLRGWVVCLFPPRLATHVSKLPSPQSSKWKEFWLCQILYWFWGNQTQAGIISGRYK